MSSSDSAIPRCPKCRQRVLWKADHGVKIRTNIIVFTDEGAIVKCRKCKADIPVDVHLGDELRKALDQPLRKLLVRKGVDSADSAQ